MSEACNKATDVFEQYANELLGYLRKKLPDGDESRELLSEVMMKLYNHCERLPEIENVRAWVYRVTYNTAMDYFRTQKRKESLPDGSVAEPAERDIYSTMADLVPDMVNMLPPDYRLAVQWSDLEGVSQKEIANRLGISLSGAKSRIQRGRKKLRELFTDCTWIESDGQGRPVSYEIKPHCNPLKDHMRSENRNLLPGGDENCGC